MMYGNHPVAKRQRRLFVEAYDKKSTLYLAKAPEDVQYAEKRICIEKERRRSKKQVMLMNEIVLQLCIRQV